MAVVVGVDRGGADALALITLADVDRRETELRSSRVAARLPVPGSAEGRQLRRWIAHSLAAEALVDLEIARAGAGAGAGAGQDAGAAAAGDALPRHLGGALGAGSIALAVLTRSAGARRFAGRLTAGVEVAPDVRARLAAGHPSRPVRTVVHRVDGVRVNGGRPLRVTSAELPVAVATGLGTARAGEVLQGPDSMGRWHEVTVLDGTVAPAAAPWDGSSALTDARARAFGRWLDGRRELLVHPRPGFEHPADPHQPDNTHRH